ncbi:MAG: exodeoxyribonuclease VII small subunit [Halorhodospira halophila]|uniref:exodeoxyribonuclease VII small subunit n=1 Tax=Halorhodospira TaxID=85108 RepID=UPI001911E5F8|nr:MULTISPECIES: exodeoxyribonuclease VII small subunit [Halorhodospira]MBK5936578.1 exodeoxyribonuclease VII small subunit [Halorhodospira halophila]MBK5944295.1 exodeoxyribonuclease VII small subunit [Halorhodospira halophila]MCC3750086.1 exodeoxyribonuclease VII small subunit [Halorhodospira halophila]MCG5527584.1 exodeoxyribonuclease VII small subunit [Halorhodospira halophila]MCG5532603.1 exodeoxyribonuclease VII small subunit [Halorhodospira sp. 9621]
MSESDSQESAPQGDLPDFERSVAELEALIERMERGEQSLEEALRDFERGIHLTRHCQKALGAAEQKVAILLENSEDGDVGPFRPDDS